MGFKASDLWRKPVVNPINKKARSVPILNPIDQHGRVFFFSWLGFMLAFWAWYTFPPLLSVTIKTDLHLTSEEVANSNIVSLVATLAVRFAAGPLCDLIGPRKVFSLLLLVGSIPVGLAPLIKNAAGLYTIRFFIGILGGSFVPCQVWCTGWFDKNVVGTANALAGGWGNAGGGITYFIMPAVYDSLVHRWGHTAGEAWRITFVVPLVCLIVCGAGLLLLCEDTPTGKWNDRHANVTANLTSHHAPGTIVAIPGNITSLPASTTDVHTPFSEKADLEKAKPSQSPSSTSGTSTPNPLTPSSAQTALQNEIILPPTLSSTLPVIFSLHAFFHVATYACSFGGELAINSVLGAYYLKNFPSLGQTNASNYAAVFGFLNFVTRPLGGVVGDLGYKLFSKRRWRGVGGDGEGETGGNGGLWAKKAWIHVCGLCTGALLIVIGMVDPKQLGVMVGLVVVMAFFHEAGNGANFALLPHVYPYANGVLSGVTGAGGNLGGVVFAIIFRFMDGGTNYAKGFWVIGVIHVVVNLAVCWIPPIPKGQVGGR